MLKQLQKNSLSLISLVVALSALSYNTWRNEQSEYNRNIRNAGFEVLLHIGDTPHQQTKVDVDIKNLHNYYPKKLNIDFCHNQWEGRFC